MSAESAHAESDQTTANTAFVAIDKGLLSTKVSEQVEAIVKFPALFDKHPFPLLINSSMLKLADVFRVGSNFTRLCILRVCQQSERHLDKILNVDEVVRRTFSVMHSNDPVARGLALSTLASFACIIPERKEVHHSIRKALDSHDPAELQPGVLAAQRFAAVSSTFANNISAKIAGMVESVATPAHIKLQLFRILEHMHHDTHTAVKVRELCVRLLPSLPSEEFVIINLQVLTQLAARTLVDIPLQVDLLLDHLNNEVRHRVKSTALKHLSQLAEDSALLWTQENQASLVQFAEECAIPSAKRQALSVLGSLVRAVPADTLDLTPSGRLVNLCQTYSYHHSPRLACEAVQLFTDIATQCNDPEVWCLAVSACDSLLLLLTSSGAAASRQLLPPALRCAVRLATSYSDAPPAAAAAGQLVESLGCLTRSVTEQLVTRRHLLSALCAVGCRRPQAIEPLLSDVLALLQESHTDQHVVIQLCTLMYQIVDNEAAWPDSHLATITAASQRINAWNCYRVARQAMRFSQHEVAASLLRSLRGLVSSEQMHFWLTALMEMSSAELCLRDQLQLSEKLQLSGTSDDLRTLSTAAQHYARALSSLRATSSPVQQLEFPVVFCRLRWRWLQLHCRLRRCCRTLQTSPPPCVAIAAPTTSRDDSLRAGRVLPQLQSCECEFRSLALDYSQLYRSSFDADPGSLACIRSLQRCCLLVADAVNWAVRRQFKPDNFAIKSRGADMWLCGVYTACERACAVVQRAHQLTASARSISHQHISALLLTSRLLTSAPLVLPRRFFQTLQTTVISLSLQPQPRVMSDCVISHPISSRLVVKVDGVISHGVRRAVYRSIDRVQLSVTAALQPGKSSCSTSTAAAAGDSKPVDSSISMNRTAVPHNDYFHGQFLLDLRTIGIHTVTVDADIIDGDGVVWCTSCAQQLTIKAFDETLFTRSTTRPAAAPAAAVPTVASSSHN